MKVVLLSLIYDKNLRSASELLQQHYTTAGWAGALHKEGVAITEVKRFWQDEQFVQDGVNYVLVNDGKGATLSRFSLPLKLVHILKEIDADVVHVSGMVFPFQVYMLRKMLPTHTAVIVQSHGGKPLSGWREVFSRKLNSVADGFIFTTHEQGMEWFAKDASAFSERIFSVMEGSTHFRPTIRLSGKSNKLDGSPTWLWIGTLDANKDPITVLTGIETIFAKQPAARLYMIYNDENLLQEVNSKIESSEVLRQSVTLVGKVPHSEIETYLNKADYFVLGSHHEGSGYALCEALACGCVPVVTDIPSFRMMTDNGQIGALREPGSVQSFIQAAQSATNKNRETESQKCIAFFNDALSFHAIAKKAVQHYTHVIQRRKTR